MLTIHYLEEDKPGLDNLDVLLLHLNAKKSNGGDTRCLCNSCLHYWSLYHFRARLETTISSGAQK